MTKIIQKHDENHVFLLLKKSYFIFVVIKVFNLNKFYMRNNHVNQDCLTCKQRLNSIFCELKNEELLELNQQKFCSLYKKGQVLFHEGANPHALYIINSGKVKLLVNVDGKEQIVRLGQNGDTIGYRALLSKDKYSATAITMEDSKICTIPSQFFFKIIEENIKVAMSYTSLLAKELREAQTKMAELALKPVRERIAEALIVLKETFGYDQDGQTINVNISREEIAQLAGTATETSIRLLSELKKSNIIDFDKKRIKILEPKKLLVEANLWD